MKRLAGLLAAVVVIVGFAGSGHAEDKDTRFDGARGAVEAAGVKVLETRTGKDFRGREALVLRSSTTAEEAVDLFLDLFRTQKEISGWKIAGLGHSARGDDWNITFRQGEYTQVVKVKRAEKGSEMTVRLKKHVPIKPPSE